MAASDSGGRRGRCAGGWSSSNIDAGDRGERGLVAQHRRQRGPVVVEERAAWRSTAHARRGSCPRTAGARPRRAVRSSTLPSRTPIPHRRVRRASAGGARCRRRCATQCRPGDGSLRPMPANGRNTSGYSRPLLLCRVTICTRRASDSSRSSCVSSSGSACGDAPAQPVDQAVQAERARLRFLQRFGELQVVARRGARRRPGRAGVRRCAAHRSPTSASGPPRSRRSRQRQRRALPVAVRVAVAAFERIDRGGIHADQHGRQRRAQAAVVAALQQRQQQRVQLARFAGGEQALLAGRHRGDAGSGERLLDARGFEVRAHQHRDVAGLHRRAIDAWRGRRARRDSTAWIAATQAAVASARESSAFQRLDVALRIRRRRGRLPQRQRGRGRAIAQEIGVVAPAAGNDVVEARCADRRRRPRPPARTARRSPRAATGRERKLWASGGASIAVSRAAR